MQIRLMPDQARALERLATRTGKSMAELIRLSVDKMLRSKNLIDPGIQRQTAIAAAGKLHGRPQDLSVSRDRYLVQRLEEGHAG